MEDETEEELRKLRRLWSVAKDKERQLEIYERQNIEAGDEYFNAWLDYRIKHHLSGQELNELLGIL